MNHKFIQKLKFHSFKVMTFNVLVFFTEWFHNTLTIEVLPLDKEAVSRRFSVKNVCLKALQNSKENMFVGVSFLTKLQGWGLQLYLKRVSSVNFAKFLRTPLLQSTSGRLLLWMETNLNCFKPLMSCNECQEFSHTLT